MAVPIPVNKYSLHCDYCGWHKIVKGNEDTNLTEVKLAEVPGGVPRLNIEDRSVEKRENFKRRRMFKCAQCGRGVIAKFYEVYEAVHKTKEDIKNEQEKDFSKGNKDGLTGFDFSSNPATRFNP